MLNKSIIISTAPSLKEISRLSFMNQGNDIEYILNRNL